MAKNINKVAKNKKRIHKEKIIKIVTAAISIILIASMVIAPLIYAIL